MLWCPAQGMYTVATADLASISNKTWLEFMQIPASPGGNMGPMNHMHDSQCAGMYYSYLCALILRTPEVTP
jgi:hypothetical protein